jgi:hypothetical protein
LPVLVHAESLASKRRGEITDVAPILVKADVLRIDFVDVGLQANISEEWHRGDEP